MEQIYGNELNKNHITESKKPPLHIGVLLDSMVIPLWIGDIISKIIGSEILQLDLVLLVRGANNKAYLEKPISSKFKKYESWTKQLLFSLYEQLDYKLFRKKVDRDLYQPIDLSSILNKDCIHTIQYNQDTDLLRNANIDVLINLSTCHIKSNIYGCIKYGVWSASCCYESYHSKYSAFFNNILDGKPVSVVGVLVEGGSVLGQKNIFLSYTSTNTYSLYLNRNAACSKIICTIIGRLTLLYHYSWEFIEELNYPKPELGKNADSWVEECTNYINNFKVIAFIIKLMFSLIKKKIRSRFSWGQWFIAFCKRKCSSAENMDDVRDMSNLYIIKPPQGHFYADPFIIKKDKVNYIFFENYVMKKDKGIISCVEIDSTGKYKEPYTVLERNYHLSYPFIFEWEEQIYMIPETSMNRTIELYRATSFPFEWSLEKVVMENIQAADTTLFYMNGKLWMFTNIAENGISIHDELYLFYSESLLGKWHPHPLNPVVSDVKKARPAGKLFFCDGFLIRPGQDCLKHYGSAISLNRVDILNETEYREVEIGRIEAGWAPGNLCTHTLNFNEEYKVIDGKFRVNKNGSQMFNRNLYK